MVVFMSKTFFHYKCPLFLLCENNSKRSNFQVVSNHYQINQKMRLNDVLWNRYWAQHHPVEQNSLFY